jgi:hypothetical protein
MGATPGPALVDQVSFSYTSTRSTFIMNVAGKVQMNITFMSPVYPEDLGRQAMTFSYLNVDVRSVDGAPHSVHLYADVSGGKQLLRVCVAWKDSNGLPEWASGDKEAPAKWEMGRGEGVIWHKFYRQDQRVFSESNDQADWGNWYWSTKDASGVSHGDRRGS